jgi:DHA3 family macrolide efflux protein-like MFS transporter
MASNEEYVAPRNGFRTFVVLWATQSVSALGSQLTGFALIIWLSQSLYPRADQKPQLAFALSAVALAWGAANIFSAPVAGSWADSHDRKRTMMVADIVSGLLGAVTALLIVNGNLNLPIVVAVAAIGATAASFHYSAFDTSYVMIVPEEQLPRANGMMQTMWAMSGLVSPALAAGIVALPGLARQGIIPGAVGETLRALPDGTALAIGIDAVTFFMAASVLPFLFVPSPKRTALSGEPGKKSSLWSDVRLGVRYIWHRKPLLWLLATFTVINFASAPLEVFLPLLLRFNLAADWQAQGFIFESALAMLATSAAVGGVVGGLFISAWGGLKRRRVYGVVIPVLIAGIIQVIFGLSNLIYLSVAMNFLLVALVPIMNAHSQTIWQTQTPRELQGRVFAVRRLIAQFSSPLAVFLAGILGGLFDPGLVLAVLGAFVVIFCIGQLFNPYLLRVEDKAYLDSLAESRSGNGDGGEPPILSDGAAPEAIYRSDGETATEEPADLVGGRSKD